MPGVQQWEVYFVVNSRHAKRAPKDKFVVIACFDPNPCGFFINSRINTFVQQNPRLLPCMVVIPARSHAFLQYDSWLDCRELLSFQDSELTDRRGIVAPETLPSIHTAVSACPVLRPRFKRLILGSDGSNLTP